MAISAHYKLYLEDQLRLVPELLIKPMFGGLGIYSGTAFFAVADNDALFFKVDDETRPPYENAGMPGWDPMGTGPSKGYAQVPPDVLDDPNELLRWAVPAIGVALKKKSLKPKK